MAIKKKLIHINEFTNFNSMKLSANVNNTQYTVGVDGAVTSGTPDILWQSIVWIKDTKQQWTHGVLYDLDDSVYVLPFTAQNLMDSADDEGGVIQIEGYVDEIDEAIKANKTFMVRQHSNSMWNVVFLEFTKQSPIYRFICIVDQRIVRGEITINGNFATTMSCVDFTPVNIQDEIAKGSSNIYIADFSYETAKEQQFRVSSEFIQAIYDNKVILVPLYPSDFGTVGYAIVETPEIDGSEVYFSLRNASELILVYGGITDDGGAEVYNDGILHFVSTENLKTINGQSLVGSGDITISGGSSGGGSGAYEEVNHGTSDTTFTLTPNTFHVWDEVTSLDLDFGAETSGVANEYLFQFTSGSTATTLTLPDDIKWANDSAPVIETNKTYQVSVLKGLGSVLGWSNAVDVELIENKATLTTAGMSATVTFQYPVASNLQVTTGSGEATIVAGETEVEVDWSPGDTIISITPPSDSTYIYTFDA